MQKGEWTCCPTCVSVSLSNSINTENIELWKTCDQPLCWLFQTLHVDWWAAMSHLSRIDVWLLMKSRCFQACGMFAPLPLSLSIHSTLKGHLLCDLMALQSTKTALKSNSVHSSVALGYFFCMFVSTLVPVACKYVFVWRDLGRIGTTQVFAVMCAVTNQSPW